MDFLHPANAQELTTIAEETGAEALSGPLRYPSETGGWQLGDVDLSEHLARYRDCEVTLIIAATGRAEEQVVCGICGFVMNEVGECPRCRLINAETARQVRAKQKESAAMLREVEAILKDEGE